MNWKEIVNFNQVINTPEVFLNEDFIGVWDNVTLDDFNNLVIKTLDESIQVVPRSNTSVKDAQLDIAAFNPIFIITVQLACYKKQNQQRDIMIGTRSQIILRVQTEH